MNLTFVTMSIAVVLAVGLVVNVVVLNFAIGSIQFFFGKPKFSVLRTRSGKNGLAFGFRWNSSKEPASFDKIRVVLYNPFGNPSQIDISKEFSKKDSNFGIDLDLGSKFGELLKVISFPERPKARVMVEISASSEGINHQFEMSAEKFSKSFSNSEHTLESYEEKYGVKKAKILYPTVKRSFVADPLPATGGKKLKIAVNPEFAGAFAPAGAAEDSAVENFSISKVWIEPGCIVCDACETIIPEVFDVQDATCIVRADAPLTDGLRIVEAAEACPVEVIKFDR